MSRFSPADDCADANRGMLKRAQSTLQLLLERRSFTSLRGQDFSCKKVESDG